MNSLRFFIFSLLLLGLVACSDDDASNEPTAPQQSTQLELQFRATYDDTPLVLFEAEAHPDGFDMIFTSLSFYISDLSLIQLDGSELVVKEIDRIRLDDAHLDLSSAQNGLSYVIDEIELDQSNLPAGEYQGIRFGIGVKSSLNSMVPADFEDGHPLANTGQYWTGWESYIFNRNEGKVDTDGDGEFELEVALHTGGDTTYRVEELLTPFTLTNGQTTKFPISIDYKEFLAPEGQTPYDILGTPQIHRLDQVDSAIELADNFIDAMK